jgi:hypothetical protein
LHGDYQDGGGPVKVNDLPKVGAVGNVAGASHVSFDEAACPPLGHVVDVEPGGPLVGVLAGGSMAVLSWTA